MSASEHPPDAETTLVVSGFALSQSAEVLARWEAFFERLGVRTLLRKPENIATANALVRKDAVSFAMAHVASPSSVGAPFDALSVRTVRFPPLVVTVDGAITSRERESLRKQGAAYIVEGALSQQRDEAALRAVLGSRAWSKGLAERMPIADVLQMLGNRGRPAMVSIECPHATELSKAAWGSSSTACGGGAKEACSGWSGRIYVRDGLIAYAETPGARGLEALAEMMHLAAGTVRVHEVFVDPAAPNVGRPIHNSILSAAVLIDERAREPGGGPPQPVPEPAKTAQPAGQGSVTEAAKPESEKGNEGMKTLASILDVAPGLNGAARADSNGNVQELAGQIDAENVCAVVAMSTASLDRAASLLGLGALRGWCAGSAKLSVYVHADSNSSLVAVTGAPSKSLESTSRKIAQSLTGRT